MKFAGFPLPWVLAGLVALAVGLYVLQILRTRYRRVIVVSTFLWRQAMQEAPVRKFRERFAHPWAYLLILSICTLIWLALAQPQPVRAGDGSFNVLVLDGSAGMAAGNRFESAVEALRERVAALPEDRRQVLWSGADVRTLLNPGENAVLLERRLRDLEPAPAPSRIETLLGELAMTHHGGAATEVTLFGDAPLGRASAPSFPKGFSVRRAKAAVPMAHNAGITALGVTGAQSGRWDAVDVYLQALSNDAAAVDANALQIDLDGKPVASALRKQADGWLLRNVPARGGVLTVRLAKRDALALDDTASIRLPDKPFIRVLLSPALDDVLRSVLTADPAVRLVDADANLVIRQAGEEIGGALPALEFVAASRQPQAFLLTYPATLESDARFAEAVDAIGLRQIDATALADAARRPIEVAMREGPQWKLSLWQELLGEDFNFTRSRAFPLFVANAVRWLAGTQAAYPFAAAGRPLSSDAIGNPPHVVDAARRAIDPPGVPFVAEQAGNLELDGRAGPLAVSLLDPLTTVGGDSAAIEVREEISGAGPSADHWITALLVLALLLLAAEWYGYRRGRLP
ncbi:MAG: BatA and WFA domain-containing protein [Gammaproteobacteria bacterium]